MKQLLWSSVVARSPDRTTATTAGLPPERRRTLGIWNEETFGQADGTVGRPCHNLVNQILLGMFAVLPAIALAAEPGNHSPVAVRVNGQVILAKEVDAALAAALKDREVPEAARQKLREETLTQLVDRRLALEALARAGEKVPAREIDAALERLKAKLGPDARLWTRHLAEQHLTEDLLRDQLAWQLTWKIYLDKHLTDANLEKFFESHRRDYDGTLVRVSHILLRPDSRATGADLTAKAQRIKQELDDDKLSFADAAKKYSTGPSREQAGDLGLIPRRGVMDEAFSRTAFALDKGQVSPPVTTPFGVHLIQATEIQPGKKSWREVRESLRSDAAQYLFDRLVRTERGTAKIEYSQ